MTGGVGFRYEIARKYGIHMGLDLAFAPGNTAVYVQVGSAGHDPDHHASADVATVGH